MVRRLLVLPALAVAALAQVAVSPSTFNTSLQWWGPNPNFQFGNGSTATFAWTALNIPIIAGTAFATYAGGPGPNPVALDNGSGGLTGPGISSGSVNYSTGALSVTFASAPPNNVPIYFGYRYLDGSGAVQPYWCGGNLGGSDTCYEPIVLTASGGSGITSANPYKWTIYDQNGDALAGVTSSGGNTNNNDILPATANGPGIWFGTLDCAGSSTNTVCSYSAPYTMPSGPAVTIKATDGSTTGASAGTFHLLPGMPKEWMVHRARAIEMNNEPYSIAWQASAAIWPNPFAAGTWVEFPYQSNDDVAFPATAGSDINRPAYSYDGKWFNFFSDACNTHYFCPQNAWYLVPANGANPVAVPVVLPDGNEGFGTWDYFQPDWLVLATGDGTNNRLWVDQLPSQTFTQAAIFADSHAGGLTSQMGGSSLADFKEGNFVSGCIPSTNCSVGGQGPEVYTYNLAPCEASLATNCATLAAQFNLNLVLGGFDPGGNPHAVTEEHHVHDFYFDRGTSNYIYNYGPAGSGGEGIFYLVPDNVTSASQATQLYPQQAATINANYWSHPAVTANASVIVSGALPFCNATGEACTTSGNGGTVFWDLRLNGHCVNPETWPGPPGPLCGLLNFDTTSVGHAAADGFDVSRLGHDNGGGDIIGGVRSELFWDTLWNQVNAYEALVYNWGSRPNQSGAAGNNGSRASYFLGPTQSPDATKEAEAMGETQSYINSAAVPVKLLPWVFDLRSPDAPILVTLASTSAARIQWWPAPLNHEAQEYWVWKQPSCAGSWTRLAPVAANYTQNIAMSGSYSYTDGTLSSGQSACYGVTTEDWSDAESSSLSALLEVQNTSGTFSVTGRTPAGTVSFDSAAPDPATGFTATAEKVCSTNCGGGVDTPGALVEANDQPNIATTLSAAVTVPGTQSVAVASTANISAGLPLTVDSGGSQETVTVLGVGGGAIKADFTKTHSSGVAVAMGALASGTWHVEVTYCKFTNFPLDTTYTETKPSGASPVVVSANDAIQIVTNGEMVGEDGVVVYAESPTDSGNFHKDSGCLQTPDYGSPNYLGPVFAVAARAVAVLTSHNDAGAAPPASNATQGGYQLVWTNPSDTWLRRVLVLYREGSAPSASNPWPYEVAALAPGTTSYYDGNINQAPSGHIYYAIEEMDVQGKLSSCVAYDATAGSSVSCAP